MEISDIGKKTGIDSIDLYQSKGLILDLHLTGKLPYDDAVSWAREGTGADGVYGSMDDPDALRGEAGSGAA